MSTGVDRQTEVTVLVAVVQNDTVIHANMSTGWWWSYIQHTTRWWTKDREITTILRSFRSSRNYLPQLQL